VLGEGDFVLAVNVGVFDNEPSMFYDFYRLDNNMIVEHWDVIEDDSAKTGMEERQWKILT